MTDEWEPMDRSVIEAFLRRLGFAPDPKAEAPTLPPPPAYAPPAPGYHEEGLPPVGPIPKREIEKKLPAEGYRQNKSRGKGSHTVWTKSGSRPVVLPDAKELSMAVVRSTAKTLGYPSVKEFRQALDV